MSFDDDNEFEFFDDIDNGVSDGFGIPDPVEPPPEVESSVPDFIPDMLANDDFFAPVEPEIDPDELLNGLNPEQEEAVRHLDGPLLILAGAGSGKTRVITYRIAYMLKKHKIAPGSILAITFTNKAATEMKERIEALVGESSKYIWCGTFHSIFARILRRHADLIGYDKNFTIVDTDDQQKLIKQAMTELEISDKVYKPRNFQFEISNAKNHMVSPKEYETAAYGDQNKAVAAQVYKKYNEKLVENNSMDFDDILNNMARLLKENPEVLSYYQEKFKYIMVDEYQDTNKPQYATIMQLASAKRNICVVGDDDQSIYAFRGADVRMILSFEKDFKDCKVIKLEQNYRSTKTILSAANEVIANNKSRKDKALRTDGDAGEKIIVVNTDSQNRESEWVANTIKLMVSKGKFEYKDVAILYRMNALSRNLESALREKQIPFKIYGGMRFYDRKEIKDILAYLRLINDDKDNLAFERIINVPKRGIGDTTVDYIRQLAIDNNTSMMGIAANSHLYPELSRASAKLMNFAAMINSFRDELRLDLKELPNYIDYVENESGIIDEIISQRESKGEAIDRVENLKELLTEAAEFEKHHKSSNVADENDPLRKAESESDIYFDEENKTADTLEGMLALYLENAALYTQGDSEEEGEDFVKLMSIHSSKGLEFGAVFIVGVEEGIFPGYQSMMSETDMEEERRLMYVAITRAKRNLFIALTRQRMLFGQTQCNPPSRFLREIDNSHLYRMGDAREPERKAVISPVVKARETAKKTIGGNIVSGLNAQINAKPAPASGLSPNEITVGMVVKHKRFGQGTVIKVEPIAGDALVTIDFDGMRKNMLAKSAGLTRG